MTSQDLSTIPCAQLTGVGVKLSEKLSRIGIITLQDLLFHLPYRYQDRTRITPISQCQVGKYVQIEGHIIHSEVLRHGKLQLICRMSDATGEINLRFFHFNAAQKARLSQNKKIRCFGEVRLSRTGKEMVHPEYQQWGLQDDPVIEETLRPVYPSTEGLSQQSFLKLTTQALHFLNQGHLLTELLPEAILIKLKLPNLKTALNYLHRPPPDAQLTILEQGTHPCQERLIVEELIAHQLSLQRLKQSVQKEPAPVLKTTKAYIVPFLDNLPFKLTLAQHRVCQEIFQDIKKPHPMMRLVQGDVGSGKTVVAAMSLLAAIESGYQAALMAPTEILAEQHYRSFQTWLAPLGIKITWLAGKTKGKARNVALTQIENHEVQLIIGTHALFQDAVVFANLGLAVIDEQHRFGVHQRLALREKGVGDNCFPHQLIMTATPIPRTLAMACYADLDLSVIDELPPGRTPVKTIVIANERRDEVINRVQAVCQEGRQVYWVCTLIEDSDTLTCEAAENTAQALKENLPTLNIALVHGRMKSAEKEMIMADFKTGKINLLVATTVIEVGVDVPNASLMIIENAERLGLSQLHQLRGRVGRGSVESHCVLMYQTPLSHLAKQRLAIMRETVDGFKIAQKDLEIRGPGEILGTRQTGVVQFKIADVMRDTKSLEKAEQVAAEILSHYPDIVTSLVKRWLGNSEQYINA